MDAIETRLLRGDCLEQMDTLIAEGVKVDAIITDPPFGTTVCKWDSVIPFDKMWLRLNKLIKSSGAIVLFGSQPFTSALIMSNPRMFKYCWVWDKVKPTNMLNAKHQPLRRVEDIIIFAYKKTIYYPQKITNPKGMEKRSFYSYNRENEGGETVGDIKKGGVSSEYEPDKLLPVNIIKTSKVNKPIHPTQKPIPLLEYLIKTYTNEGETVLDFTMGSGTTGVACANLDRSFIGIELDDKYFKIAVERINRANKEQ